MIDYFTATAALSSFILGLFAGGYIALRLTSGRGMAASRPGHAWARMDFTAPTPAAHDTRIVKVTDWEGAPELDIDNRTLTFNIPDRTGARRELTYSAAMILRLFRCDGPTREQWRGGNSEYTRLLAIARHYAWVLPDGAGVCWAVWLSTRERRLRVIAAWLQAGA